MRMCVYQSGHYYLAGCIDMPDIGVAGHKLRCASGVCTYKRNLLGFYAYIAFKVRLLAFRNCHWQDYAVADEYVHICSIVPAKVANSFQSRNFV